MTGIEILATNEVVIKTAFNWNVFCIVLACFFGSCLIIGLLISVANNNDWSYLLCCIVAGVIFGLVLGSASGAGLSTPTAYETQYKVTISDEVPMNEFLEKYEIIDQEGKIYTIRER